MNQIYPDLTCNFPESIDDNMQLMDITIKTKPLVDQYYAYLASNDFESIEKLKSEHPELKRCLINAEMIQKLYDMNIAQQRYYMNDVQMYLQNIVKYRGNWDSSAKYTKYDVVNYINKGGVETYMGIEKEIPIGSLPTDTRYFISLTMRGEQGASGIGLSYRGEWSKILNYQADDCVSYGNKLWRALRENNNVVPMAISDDWEMVLDATITETVSIEKGGTGATSAREACENLGAVSKTGDTMTGELILPNTTPTKTYQAVHKKYVDDNAGKRTCRFVVGTSTAGWTKKDCDYLCDGTGDQVEIQAAINSLPSTGGKVVVLDGTYHITASINMNKRNVTLQGNGNATVLKRMWNGSSNSGVIQVSSSYCHIENFYINGNKENYNNGNSFGIVLSSGSSNNAITGNVCNDNNYGIDLKSSSNNTINGNICNGNHGTGIFLTNSNNNTVTGNVCNDNDGFGIVLSSGSSNNAITGNTCNNNSNTGIDLGDASNNTVTGNVCNDNDYGIDLNSSSNNTINGNTFYNNRIAGINLFIGNNNTITGNTCNGNRYGIYLTANYQGVSSNNTVTGNVCNDNDYGIYLYLYANNNTITGNTCIRGTGLSSNYTSAQYTIYLNGTDSRYNLVACNNIMGKNYTLSGGTGNTFVNNKYN